MKKGLQKVTSVLLASAIVFHWLRVEARRRMMQGPEAAGQDYSIIYLTVRPCPSSGLMWALGLRTLKDMEEEGG